MSSRTPQGAVAWDISLNTFPSVALPAYWVLGRSQFNGYVRAWQEEESDLFPIADKVLQRIRPFRPVYADCYPALLAGEKLARLPILDGNQTALLVDGEATFNSIFDGIEKARKYILVQFFIVNDDTIGRELQQRLIAKARQGVRVSFLYDEVGSYNLTSSYLEEMRQVGIEVVNFHSRKGPKNRFQINFRDHRKVILVDGVVCWIGGHNVGDTYFRPPDLRRFCYDTIS